MAGVERAAGLLALEPVDAAERIVPAQRKTHLPALAGRHADAHRQRAVLGLLEHVPGGARLLVAALAQPPGAGEFAPIEAEAVEPLAAEVIVDMLDVGAVGGDGEVAALLGRPLAVGGGEMQGREPVGLREIVDAAVAAVVPERRGDRVVDRRVRVVFHGDGEQRDRHRGVAVVVRDERAEGGHAHLTGEAGVVELELGDREAADEGDVVEMRHAGHRIAVGAESVAVELPRARRSRRRSFIGPVEDAGVEELAVALGLDGEMAVAVELMDVRPVADAPVDQPPAAGERDAAGPDAAERKSDIAPPGAGEDEAVVDGFQLLQHCRVPAFFRS